MGTRKDVGVTSVTRRVSVKCLYDRLRGVSRRIFRKRTWDEQDRRRVMTKGQKDGGASWHVKIKAIYEQGKE